MGVWQVFEIGIICACLKKPSLLCVLLFFVCGCGGACADVVHVQRLASSCCDLSCAFHLHCEQSAGWGLKGYANGSHYVIDVNISLWKFGDLMLAFL